MVVITTLDVEIRVAPPICTSCAQPKPLCKCPAGEIEEQSDADTASETSSETTSVGGTDSFALAAGHTCDFEYLQNISRLGIPFTFEDVLKYDALLQNSGPENIDAILDIGALAYKRLQQNGPTHEGSLLRGLVSVWGVDLDPEDTALKLKNRPELANDPDAAFKAALNYSVPALKPGFSA